MNVIYHHRTQGKGVEAIHIRSIAKALRELGHKVTIISPPGCNPETPEHGTGNNQSASGVKFLFSLISKKCPEFLFEIAELAYNIPIFFRLNKVLRNTSVDLIYERYFLFSLASQKLASKYNIPICYEINDSSFVPRLRKLKFVKLANYFEKKAYSKADQLIVVSGQFKQILVGHGIQESKIIICHNAIDPAIFSPSSIKDLPIDIPKDKLVLGFVGLFVKWVGLEFLLEAFQRLSLEHQNIHLLLVGGGPEEENVRQIIDRLHIDSQVTITGKVSHEDIPSYIDKIDVCIIPRHEKYTSPVKLFEYMAMGKAIVVPAYPSLLEVIEHGRNGLCFQPDNMIDLATVLSKLITDKILRKNLGEAAKSIALEKHTWRNNAEHIIHKKNKTRPYDLIPPHGN